MQFGLFRGTIVPFLTIQGTSEAGVKHTRAMVKCGMQNICDRYSAE